MFVPKPGLVVGNRYALTQVIGRGGMGEVWQAHDRDLDSPCAVKFIVQHLAGDRGIRERFSREAKAAARLRSPHVVQILGVGEVESIPYLAMELLEGETLLARLSRQGRLAPGMTLKLVEQVAEALESAHHASIVHRDLKPDNIWFWSGNKVFCKVLDFGVAKTGLSTDSLQTATGALVGTPQYMSPEQAMGNRAVDHRSDLWSLAVITIECLSGKRPFESTGLGELLLKIVADAPPSLQSFAPELPASLEQWWLRALARAPGDRFQSATELADALRPHLAQLELDAPFTAGGARTSPAPLVEAAVLEVRGGTSLRRPAAGGTRVDRATPPAAAPDADADAAAAAPPAGSLGFAGASAAPLQAAPIPNAPRSPGSVGPTSSSRRPPAAAPPNRRRSLLIAAALVVAALLITWGRLSQREASGPPPPVAAAPVENLPPPSPTEVSPAEVAGTRAPVRPPVEPRIAPIGASPWDDAQAGAGKAKAPETAAAALQARPESAPASTPQPEGRATPANLAPPSPTISAPPAPAPATAPVASPLPRAVRAGNATPSTSPRPSGEAPGASVGLDLPATAPSSVEGPSATEVARKKRLRDLVGLPKRN